MNNNVIKLVNANNNMQTMNLSHFKQRDVAHSIMIFTEFRVDVIHATMARHHGFKSIQFPIVIDTARV